LLCDTLILMFYSLFASMLCMNEFYECIAEMIVVFNDLL
jgi:hypothetical protein